MIKMKKMMKIVIKMEQKTLKNKQVYTTKKVTNKIIIIKENTQYGKPVDASVKLYFNQNTETDASENGKTQPSREHKVPGVDLQL